MFVSYHEVRIDSFQLIMTVTFFVFLSFPFRHKRETAFVGRLSRNVVGGLWLAHLVKHSNYLLLLSLLALLRAPFFLGALSACAGALSWAVLSTGAVAGSVLSGLLAFTSAISLP